MTRKERVRYEMLSRVKEFGNRHRELFPESSTSGQMFDKVSQAIDGIEAHTTTKLLAAKDGRQAKTAARATVRQALRALVRTARGAARMAPGSDDKFRMPTRKSDVALLTTARALLHEAEGVKDTLVQLGLPPTFVTDLQKATDALEEAMRGRGAGRSIVAAAQAGITAALAHGSDAVQLLDVLVANAAEHDPVVFAAWQRDRRVVEGQPRRGSVATVPTVPPVANSPEQPAAEAREGEATAEMVDAGAMKEAS